MKQLAKRLVRKAFGWLVREIKEEIQQELDKRTPKDQRPPFPGSPR